MPNVLNHCEQSVLRASPACALVEDSHPQVWRHNVIRDGEHLLETNELFHLDGAVGIEEAFKLNAQNVGQLAYELLMLGVNPLPVVHVVVNELLFEV